MRTDIDIVDRLIDWASRLSRRAAEKAAVEPRRVCSMKYILKARSARSGER
jgi:hypothetical protein